jgi:serine protease Do
VDQRKQYIQGVLGRSKVAGKRLDHAGSGFFVSVDGDLITTSSVIDGCSVVSISPMYGEIALARVVQTEPSSGIALLRADITVPGVAILTGSEGAFYRHPIYVLGYPQLGSVTGEPTLTPVRALNSQKTAAAVPAILIDGDIRSGFNGGPVLDSGGSAIGVMAPGKTQVSGATDGTVESTGMAIPSERIVSFLEAAGVDYQTGLQLPPKPPERLLTEARPLVAQIGCWQ